MKELRNNQFGDVWRNTQKCMVLVASLFWKYIIHHPMKNEWSNVQDTFKENRNRLISPRCIREEIQQTQALAMRIHLSLIETQALIGEDCSSPETR